MTPPFPLTKLQRNGAGAECSADQRVIVEDGIGQRREELRR